MNLQDLRELLLGGYPIGTWFYVSSEHSKFATGKGLHFRPYVLVLPWETNHPIAQCRPRSATDQKGLKHAAHDAEHSATCRVRKSGFIVNQLVPVASSAINSRSFSCFEPDASVIAAITPRHLR